MENKILRDAEFKDESPLKTVERIKQILAENGIETKVRWGQSGVPYCYSNRITVDGAGFGVNGKGLTEEFALASGYGELMERLQSGFIGSLAVQKEAVFTDREASLLKKTTVAQQLEENGHWYDALVKRLYSFTGTRETPECVLRRYENENGEIPAVQYYNLTKEKEVAFPLKLHAIYTTNGAAAGNTMEEALVQGISETVERNHQLRIIREGLTMPDVPDEVLQKYTVSYSIISYLRSQGFKVVVKDASLGEKFPVICTVIVNENTGGYHTHFGSYPIFEIALQRSLTETFQGRNMETVARYKDFHYKREDAYSVNTLLEELVKGSAEKHIDFFVGTPKYPYNPEVGFRGTNNRELLLECIAYFRDLGHDVLARDRSSLGFPTYQVLIPGYSECAIHRLSSLGDDSTYQPIAVRVLRNPTAATPEELQGFCEYVNLQKRYGKMPLGNGAFCNKSLLSVKLPAALDEQLMLGTLAYVYYAVGDYSEAISYVGRMISDKTNKRTEYLTCVKRYLNMKAHGYTQEQIHNALAFFHKAQTCQTVCACIETGGNPMADYTLQCDGLCTDRCMLYGLCNQKRSQELMDLIQEKIHQMDFRDFVSRIETFFEEARAEGLK